MRYYTLVFCSIFLLNCQKEEPDINNLNGGRVMILGHGGVGVYHFNATHDNSAEAIEQAILGYGIDGVEIDLQISADSTVWLMHENMLPHVTVCDGCLPEKSDSYLENCYYKRNVNTTFLREHHLVKLEDTFEKYLPYKGKVYFYLNLKYGGICPAAYQTTENYLEQLIFQVSKTVLKYGMEDHVFIEVTDIEMGQKFKDHYQGFKLFFPITIDVQSETDIAASNGFFGVIATNSTFSKEDVKYAHAKNLWVCLFSIGSTGDAKEARNKNIEIVMPDDVVSTIKVFNEM